MKNTQKFIVVSGIVIIGILCFFYWIIRMKDPYAVLDNINNKEIFKQREEEYYIYYYKKDCPYCKRIENLIMELGNSQKKLYIVDMGKEQNITKYEWKDIHTKEDKEIGILNLDNTISYYEGENEEKYLSCTDKNKYGKTKVYEIKEADENYLLQNQNARIGYLYASIQTPEIDYASVQTPGDIIIGGVPTLLHILNGKINAFYFDAPEIGMHIKEILGE